MKNICLVQVVDSYGPNKFLPLAIAYQWLNAAKSPHVAENWKLIDVLIEKININQWVNSQTEPLHLAAISCYVWNWNFNNELAKAIKQRWPDCVIVIGGPEVHKRDPDLIRKRPWFDVAILGENEEVLPSLLLDLDLERITQLDGVVTKFTHTIVQPTRTQAINDIPSPILSGFYDDIMERYRQQNIPVKYWQVTWETMRGCPYHCAFCDIGDEYWNKTMWFDLDRIYQEIDWMGENKIEYLSVCDSNWGIHPRDLDITKYIIATKQRTGYPKILDVTWAKNNPDRVRQIVALDYDAGTNLLRGLNFSLQSMDPNSLKINARFNLRDSVLHESLRYYKQNNIPTFTELIWPLPGETVETFRQGLQSLIDLGQRDFLVIHPLIATNNSPLGQPEFREAQQIGVAVVPVDTFWLDVPDPDSYVVETEESVISTVSATYQDFLYGNMLGHWLVVMYYYGWGHLIMQYLRSAHDIKEMDFISHLIAYCQKHPDSLLGREHAATMAAYESVFEHKGFWGRRLEPPYHKLYWEYKSATCVMLQQRRQELAHCFTQLLAEAHDVHCPDLVRLNLDFCVDHERKYPFTASYDPALTDMLLGIDSGTVTFDHRDKSLVSDDISEYDFMITVYHYRRKMRYWRCETS